MKGFMDGFLDHELLSVESQRILEAWEGQNCLLGVIVLSLWVWKGLCVSAMD